MAHVTNNAERRRFELETAAGLAIADYRLAGSTMTIYHTEVPLSLRGRGIGARLVHGALEEVRRANLKVVPACSFVREFVDRNPEFADLLA